MSAFMHTDAHFAALAASFVSLSGFPQPPMSGLVNTANMLAEQNRRSVDARYEPGAFGSDEINVDEALIAHYLANPLTVAEFVKALDSYAYQACETRDWQQTTAHGFYVMGLEVVGASSEDGDSCPVRRGAEYRDADTWSISAPEISEPEPERDALVVETVVIDTFASEIADVLAGDDSDALVTAILTGDEERGLTALSQSHRGQMRRAAVALGLVTKRESRKLTRPVVADMLGKHIVQRALGLTA